MTPIPAPSEPIATATVEERFLAAATFEEFLASARNLAEFWRSSYQRARVDDGAVKRANRLAKDARLLVLNADWCGDSVSVLPYVARLAERSHTMDMRLLDRDENLDLMDRYLTRGSRSIPKIVVLDSDWVECGHWGPRPAELQRWVMEHGLALPREERYREIRSWYARDGGRTTVAEILTMLEGCLGRRSP